MFSGNLFTASSAATPTSCTACIVHEAIADVTSTGLLTGWRDTDGSTA